jgi:hypothetical protein
MDNTNNFRRNIENLCAKVQEVIDNNDWPTEEGQQRCDDSPCPLQVLVTNIILELR